MSAALREPGERIGVYTVVETLGRGGSGAVYKVRDDGGDIRALKLVDAMSDQLAAERLRREVAALQALRHDAVPRVFDAEFSDEEAFVVFEYIPGVSLYHHVQDHGPLRGEELARMAERIASALQSVHDAGVIHRDVTPANVMMGPDGAYLIDFGLAHEHQDSRLTRDGLVSGTAGYVAPEVINGAEPGVEADRWAWAATIVYAMTGEAPFGTGSAAIGRTLEGELSLPGLPGASALAQALGEDIGARPGPRRVVEALRQDVDVPVTAIAATRVMGSSDVAPTTVFVSGSGMDDGADAGDGSYDDGAEGTDEWETAPEPGMGTPISGTSAVRRRSTVPRHPFVLVSAHLAGVAIVVLTPVIGAVVLLLASAVARTEHRRALALALSRARKGKRRGDAALQTVSVPWHFLRAFVELLPAFLLAVSVAAVIAAAGVSILRSDWVDVSAYGVWPESAVLAAAGLAYSALMWWGPLSFETRDGARRIAATLAPTRGVGAAWVLVALVVTGVCVLTVYLLDGALWWPLPW